MVAHPIVNTIYKEIKVGDTLTVREWDWQVKYKVKKVYPRIIVCRAVSGPACGRIEFFERANILAPTKFW